MSEADRAPAGDWEGYHPFTEDTLKTLRERAGHLKNNVRNSAAKQTVLKGLNDDWTPDEMDDLAEGETEPDPSLEDGVEMPQYYGKFPKNFYFKPMEDLDPYYRSRGEETFCVACRRLSGKTHLYRFSASRAFFVLSPLNKIRQIAISIILHPLFDIVVLLTILVNCVFLALDEEIKNAEYFFTAFYTLEMVIKMAARGLILNQFTYLRDPWNWLDFAVVIVAYATITGSSTVSSLRAVRVLRALKSVSIIPGLRTIVDALFHSLKPLSEVLLIMCFLLIVVALIALQAYQGVLRRRCVLYPVGGFNATNEPYDAYIRNTTNWNPAEGEVVVCGNVTGSGFCPAGYFCAPDAGPNPNHGHTNFDHMGYALLTSFQLITLDFWENVYNMIIRAEGPWNVLFFLMSVFLGPFYLLNLLLAVVSQAYSKEQADQLRLEEIRTRAKERAKRRHLRKKKLQERKQFKYNNAVTSESSTVQSIGDLVARLKASNLNVQAENSVVGSNSESVAQTGIGAKNETVSHISCSGKNGAAALKRDIFKEGGKQISMDSSETSKRSLNKWQRRSQRLQNWYIATFCSWNCHPMFVSLQVSLLKIVKQKAFEIFIILCIIVNTVILAIDYHGIPTELERALDTGNKVFTFVFLAEAVVKIVAMSPIPYLKDLWNVFDFLIVVISIVELILVSVTSGSGGGWTVLRALRLLRVFRLARMWPTMKKLVSIIWKSVGAVGYLTVVLFLVLYIFAVIGKQWFSVSYKSSGALFPDNQIPRWNFGDFYHSFLLVWRVMCGEWIEPLHDCLYITREDGRCIPLFLCITFFANFMVLNLFTAILLEAFSVESLKDTKMKKKKKKKIGKALEQFRTLVLGRSKKTASNKIASGDVEGGDDTTGNDRKTSKKITGNQSFQPPSSLSSSNTRRESVPAFQLFRMNSKNKLQKQAAIQTEEDDEPAFAVTGTRPSLSRQSNVSSIDGGVRTAGDNGPITEVIYEVEDIGMNDESFANNDGVKENSVPEEQSEEMLSVDEVVENGCLIPECSILCCCACSSTRENQTQASSEEANAPGAEEKNPMEPPSCFPRFLLKRYPSLKLPAREPVLKYWYSIRKACFTLVNHQYFEWFILLLILTSTVCLTLEDVHLNNDPVKKDILSKLELVFTALFTIEMVLKWIGIGVTEYFTTMWCLLDCAIVAASWAGIFVSSQASQFRVLRALRAFRPLRAVSRWQGMKIVVDALIYCIPSIGNVLCVCLLIWFVFGIMGVQFFKGQFHRCVDANDEDVNASLIPNRTACLAAAGNYSWINRDINFDHVGNAMVALFQVATFEGWMEVMADSSDVNGVNNQPSREAEQYNTIFYVVFVLVGSFFILNLIVGVIIESFQKLSKQTDSSSAVETLLTDTQKEFYRTMRSMLNRKPKKSIPKPKNTLQLRIFDLVTNQRFEMCVFGLIVLNMITLSMDHLYMTQTWIEALRYTDIVFTTMFALEAILKLIGMRWYYFRDVFNVFDLLVVLVSITGFVLENLVALIFSPTLLRVVQVFRVFRVLRVVRAARGIRRLILTLMISIPALMNIAILLSVFIVIFAILGMTLFMNVKLTGALNDQVNFQTFANSLMVLFRLVTSAGWNDVLAPLMNTRDCDPNTDCGDPLVAVIYFVLFIFIIFLVIVNMYIAIILENFEEILQQDEKGVSQGDFETFYEVWGRYDPRATQFVTLSELSNLLHHLHPPLQLCKPNLVKIAALNLPVLNGDKVHCLDVLFALVKRIIGEVEISEEMKEEAELRLLKSFPNRKTLRAETTTLLLRQQINSAFIIQRAWKEFLSKKNGTHQKQDLRNSKVAADVRPSVKGDIMSEASPKRISGPSKITPTAPKVLIHAVESSINVLRTQERLAPASDVKVKAGASKSSVTPSNSQISSSQQSNSIAEPIQVKPVPTRVVAFSHPQSDATVDSSTSPKLSRSLSVEYAKDPTSQSQTSGSGLVSFPTSQSAPFSKTLAGEAPLAVASGQDFAANSSWEKSTDPKRSTASSQKIQNENNYNNADVQPFTKVTGKDIKEPVVIKNVHISDDAQTLAKQGIEARPKTAGAVGKVAATVPRPKTSLGLPENRDAVSRTPVSGRKLPDVPGRPHSGGKVFQSRIVSEVPSDDGIELIPITSTSSVSPSVGRVGTKLAANRDASVL